MARSPPGGTRPDTPHHHVALWLRATVEMRLRRIYAQGGVWRMCGRGRAGVRQERTAQYGGRMFVFATTQGVQGDMPSAIAHKSLRNHGDTRTLEHYPILSHTFSVMPRETLKHTARGSAHASEPKSRRKVHVENVHEVGLPKDPVIVVGGGELVARELAAREHHPAAEISKNTPPGASGPRRPAGPSRRVPKGRVLP